MNAAKLKGKTIAKVHQSRTRRGDTDDYLGWTIDAIEFTDGTFMRFITVELGYDYAVEGIYPARPAGEQA